jgi:uncharacterized protein YdeI (YjbR/CyaY-like superfamily)
MARLFIFVPEDLHDKLRIKAIETKKNHSELTTEALEQYLGFVSQMKNQPQDGESDTDNKKTE